MPQAKKSTKTSTRVPQPALSKAYESELSYETQIIITILLLLFVYPIGLILMWWWMKSWPLWLKIIISLPIFLGVLALFSGLFVLGAFLRHVQWNYGRGFMQERMYQQQMQVTTTPIPSLPTTVIPTILPTQNTSGTY